MKKHTKPSPLKSGFLAGVVSMVVDMLGNMTSYSNSPPRPQINDLCDVDDLSRPVCALEKHMAVLRKGPTMPLTLEMYRATDETADVNLTTSGAIIAGNFLGLMMDQSSNYCLDPVTPACGSYPSNSQGTAIDGSDISIFYDKFKNKLIIGKVF